MQFVNIIYKRKSIKTFPADSGLQSGITVARQDVTIKRWVAFRTDTLTISFPQLIRYDLGLVEIFFIFQALADELMKCGNFLLHSFNKWMQPTHLFQVRPYTSPSPGGLPNRLLTAVTWLPQHF